MLHLSFLYYGKRLFNFFSRVIIVQEFETITFYVLFVYKPTLSVIFCWMKRLRVSSLFILYISTAKPFSLVRGVYWSEEKQARNLVSFVPAYLRCLKYIKGIFNPLAQLFLDTSAVISRKKSEIVGENFFQLWKCILVDFIEISGHRCANTNIHWRKLKHPT